MTNILLKLNKYSYLAIAICFFVTAAIIENGLLKKHPEKHLIEDFQEKLIEHEKELEIQQNRIAETILSDDFEGNFNESLHENNVLLEEMGIGFLVYENGILRYWSDRSISFYSNIEEFKNRNGLVKLPNGFYFAESLKKDNFEIVGLHLIKYNYVHENKYLQNSFFKHYNLPSEFEIKAEKYKGAFEVENEAGDFLFSILPVGQFLCTTNQLYLPGIIYFLGLLFLLYYFRREFIESVAPFFLNLFGLGTALFIVYWLHLIFNIPKLLSHLAFFSPQFFALNDWLPSLGDFFLLSIFFFFWLYNFGMGLSIKQMHENSKLPPIIIVSLLILFSGSLFLLSNYFIESLINNSTISFSLNKIIDVSVHSVLGIFSVGMILFSILFFTIKIVEEIGEEIKNIKVIGIVIGVSLFLSIVQIISIERITYSVLVFFIVSSILALLLSKNYLRKLSLTYLILFVSVASVYSLVIFHLTVREKERNIQKLFAVTLVAEHDPAAEEFLSKIQNQITSDPAIQSLLSQYEQTSENDEAREYIRRAYFNNYFRKYQFKLYICNSTDSLEVGPENQLFPCYAFMDTIIQNQGTQVPGTNFYFMDNMNGRISYTGRFHFPLSSSNSGLTIYIDLDSDLLFEGIGFPELLIDKSMTRSGNYKKFDYAKYYGGDLTDKFGDYNYNFYIDNYKPTDEEFSYKIWDNREHLIYHTHENNYVIVSRELFTFIDYLISFPYLFVFYFISILILLFLGNVTIRNRATNFDLKFKIQAAIISIVFVSLLLVALATIFYNIEEYKSKHQNDLNEKMKSISEEIDMRLEDKDEITETLEIWLHSELAKLSNIFRTDINIYGIDGNLISSSRVEIFERGLVSSRINPQAYYELFQNFQVNHFQPEKIGQLSYLSAYKPIINNKGNYLGFINLPYFIKQDKYSQEISTFIVAFINLYVLLFLVSIITAVFISNQITRPLVVIQENLRKMQLGKHNEPIIYNRKDEIGSLVREYNKKVGELAVSADLLARSERESAWREMAKQIAHEIKNPLTPMKLNIQYLQRTKGDNEEYNKYLERVTSTLIEQIDNLSNIATEFSNFAKIPTARNQVFHLCVQLQKVIDLYETHDRAHIEFISKGMEEIEVNADREQLSRAIINLIRNGIQSVPDNREGKIKIWIERREEKAIIVVKDDGLGIAVDLRDKLFSPSFTTKTSGMGLGLAIVKNIVENFSGKIWFETELGKGTTFFLEIPIYNQEEIPSA